MRKFLNQLVPFIFLGIAIVAFSFGIILLAYLFLFGALIGTILYLASWLKNRIFPPKDITPREDVRKKTGRIIDTDDWRKL